MTALILLSEWNASQVEFWMPVKDYPGYDVSNFGRVRSYWQLERLPGQRCGFRFIIGDTWKIIQPRKSTRRGGVPVNHLRVGLHRNGKQRGFYVHRLVSAAFSKAFKPNIRADQVNHLNAIQDDNRLDNLERTDHIGNQKHATRYGLRPRGTLHGCATLTEDQVREIRKLAAAKVNQDVIAEMFHIKQPTVSAILVGRIWKWLE